MRKRNRSWEKEEEKREEEDEQEVGKKKRIEMSDKRYKLDVEKYILGAYCWRLRKT